MPTIDRTIGAFFDASTSRLRRIGNYVGPASYVTGGDPFLPADVAMGRIEQIDFSTAVNVAGSLFRTLVWNPATNKVIWLDITNGAEIGNGTDLSGFSARFEAIGQ